MGGVRIIPLGEAGEREPIESSGVGGGDRVTTVFVLEKWTCLLILFAGFRVRILAGIFLAGSLGLCSCGAYRLCGSGEGSGGIEETCSRHG